jgi:hypothetical protein
VFRTMTLRRLLGQSLPTPCHRPLAQLILIVAANSSAGYREHVKAWSIRVHWNSGVDVEILELGGTSTIVFSNVCLLVHNTSVYIRFMIPGCRHRLCWRGTSWHRDLEWSMGPAPCQRWRLAISLLFPERNAPSRGTNIVRDLEGCIGRVCSILRVITGGLRWHETVRNFGGPALATALACPTDIGKPPVTSLPDGAGLPGQNALGWQPLAALGRDLSLPGNLPPLAPNAAVVAGRRLWNGFN